MAKTTLFATNWNLHLFQNANIALIGDATGLRGSTTAGSLYFSLHVGNPGVGGIQTTNEIAYTGYARVAVARSAGGFTVNGVSVSPAGVITFGTCTVVGTSPATHFGIGTAASGAGSLLRFGPLTPSVAVIVGTIPTITTASTFVEA